MENNTPIKMVMPLNAGELEPGIYGKAATKAKTIMIKRTRR